jgi:putative peptidoglycan lipid II flippase
LADAFNLANTVPNMVFDLVLGGVASATFIPVFVERLAVASEREAWESISSVVTGAIVVLAGTSLVAWLFAPQVIQGFTSMQHGASHHLGSQRAVAVQLLRWFIPQIFFYGVIGISTSLLNIRNRFSAGAWTPVVNNIVCIAVLIWFHQVEPHPTVSSVSSTQHLMYLGVGTTFGVALQFLCLLPSLSATDLYRLRLRINFADPAIAAVRRLGAWTLAVVLANQASLYVVLAVAFSLGGSGPVSAYTYGWSFMQMPYAVVVVSVLSSLTPQLARFATESNFEHFSSRLRFGLRQSLVIIIPCTLFLVVLGSPLVALLLHHADLRHPLLAGTVLRILAVGLPGFTVFQLGIRGLQAMQRAKEVFALYAVENLLNIALAYAIGRHSMAGLTGSVTISYSVCALLVLYVLSRHGVSVWSELFSTHVRRSLVASVCSLFVMTFVYSAITASVGLGLFERFMASAISGVAVYLVVLFIGLSRERSGPKEHHGVSTHNYR